MEAIAPTEEVDHDDGTIIEFSETILSIITTEGKISNINYKRERDLIFKIIASLPGTILSTEWLIGGDDRTCMDLLIIHMDIGDIRVANIDCEDLCVMEQRYIDAMNSSFKVVLAKHILRIGCNYGEFLSKAYIKLKSPKKRTNRGRKRKEKKLTRRKGVGLRRYFNSEITFTVVVDGTKDVDTLMPTDALYHMKLYTNGKIQVPSVRDNNVYVIQPVVMEITDMVKQYDDVTVDPAVNCDIVYIKSIMRNYKFNIVDESILIDIKRFKLVVSACKKYFEGEHISDWPSGMTPELLEEYRETITKYPLALVKYNNDKYVGFIIKFFTPSVDYPERNTTVKIFHSGKFNIDACNTQEQGDEVKAILLAIVKLSIRSSLYRRDEE